MDDVRGVWETKDGKEKEESKVLKRDNHDAGNSGPFFIFLAVQWNRVIPNQFIFV